jgi:hypothetical protein
MIAAALSLAMDGDEAKECAGDVSAEENRLRADDGPARGGGRWEVNGLSDATVIRSTGPEETIRAGQLLVIG